MEETCWKHECTAIQCDDGNEVDWDGCTKGIITEFNVLSFSPQELVLGGYVEAASIGEGLGVLWKPPSHDISPQLHVLDASLTPAPAGAVDAFNSQADHWYEGLAIVELANGTFVVGTSLALQPGEPRRVVVRQYSASGVPNGDDITANTTTDVAASIGNIAARPEGGFTVVWSEGSVGEDQITYGRLFSSAGEPDGPPFQLSDSQHRATTSRVAAGSTETQFFTWAQDTVGGYPYKLIGRLRQNGGTLGDFVEVAPGGNGKTLQSLVAMDGGYAIAWRTHFYEQYLRFFNASGQPTTNPIEAAPPSSWCGVNSDFYTVDADLIAHSDGTVLLTWQSGSNQDSNCELTMDGSGDGIVLSQYSTDGMQIGSHAVVNQYLEGDQHLVGIESRPGGGFVVLWVSPAPDLEGDQRLYAQQFNADGTKKYK